MLNTWEICNSANSDEILNHFRIATFSNFPHVQVHEAKTKIAKHEIFNSIFIWIGRFTPWYRAHSICVVYIIQLWLSFSFRFLPAKIDNLVNVFQLIEIIDWIAIPFNAINRRTKIIIMGKIILISLISAFN